MLEALQLAPDGDLLTVSGAENTQIAAVADRLRAMSPRIDDDGWIAAARTAWEDLPAPYRRRVREFRRHSGPAGAMVFRGLPIDDPLPATPSMPGAVQRMTTRAAAVLMMTACGLGDPAAYRREKRGALVQDVVPVPGLEKFQGNAGSVELMMHNENAFHQHRPDYVMLFCLRPDHERIAGLHTSSIREALPLLTDTTRELLAQPIFSTAPPPSFGTGDGEHPRHAVLTGDPDDPDVQVDFAATTAVTEAGKQALAVLNATLETVARTARLLPGDLAVVDNRVCLHGRSAFQPRYDGQDRWLQRTFVLTELRRSRDHRPHDGYVLER